MDPMGEKGKSQAPIWVTGGTKRTPNEPTRGPTWHPREKNRSLGHPVGSSRVAGQPPATFAPPTPCVGQMSRTRAGALIYPKMG